MTASPLPRHRGTWSTIFIVLIFALGICTMVFGIFNLATNIWLGLSAIALGFGLIIPGVWWLRWYQKPRMLRGILPLSILLLVPGAVGIAMSTNSGSAESDAEPVVASSSPSSSSSSAPSTTQTAPVTSSPTAPTTSIELVPSTTAVETPEPVIVPQTPEPQISPISPPLNNEVSPDPAIPTESIAPAPVGPPEIPEPEVPAIDNPEAPVSENPVLEPGPTPAPKPAPDNPWRDLILQFFQ